MARRGTYRHAAVAVVGLISACLLLALGLSPHTGHERVIPVSAPAVPAALPVPADVFTADLVQNVCPKDGPVQEEPGTGHARPRCDKVGFRPVKMPDGGTTSFLDVPRAWAIAPPRGFHGRPRCTERRPAGTRTLLLQVLRR
ncbi:MAG TPA: hypothetical protein VHJ17_17900 [Thermomonospora sp.]|nr:hypothetical protein [Thermomonospora sp.]